MKIGRKPIIYAEKTEVLFEIDAEVVKTLYGRIV